MQKEQQEKQELAAQVTVPTQSQDSSSDSGDSRTSSKAEVALKAHNNMHSCLYNSVKCVHHYGVVVLQVKAKLEALEDAIKLMQVRQLIQDMTGMCNLAVM